VERKPSKCLKVNDKVSSIVLIIAVTPAAYKPAVEAITIYVTPVMLLFHIERKIIISLRTIHVTPK
jgi:hypothetical protein